MKKKINKILNTIVYKDEEDIYTVSDFLVTAIVFLAIILGLGICGTLENVTL